MVLHAKYQGSWPCGFREEVFLSFPYNPYVKSLTPEQSHFWLQGYNLNKLGRGLLYDARYQIARLWTFLFQTRRVLKFHLETLF